MMPDHGMKIRLSAILCAVAAGAVWAPPAQALGPSGACPMWKENQEIRDSGLRNFCWQLQQGVTAVVGDAPAIAIDHFSAAARLLDSVGPADRDAAADELTIAVAIARAQNTEWATATQILENFHPRSAPDLTLLARGYLLSRMGRLDDSAALLAKARTALPGQWCGPTDGAALADLQAGRPPQGRRGDSDPAAGHRLPSWLGGPGQNGCNATVGAVVAPLPPVRSYQITFALNSSRLLLDSGGSKRKKEVDANTAILTQMQRIMAQYPDRRFTVVGRSDESCGGLSPARCQSGNLALSQQRADAVRDWLNKQATAPSRLTAEGVGTAGIPYPHNKPKADPRNRIVDFIPTESAGAHPTRACPWEVAAYSPELGARQGRSVTPVKLADLHPSVQAGDHLQPTLGPSLASLGLQIESAGYFIPAEAGLRIRFRADLAPNLTHIYVRDRTAGSGAQTVKNRDLAAMGGMPSAGAGELVQSNGWLPRTAGEFFQLDNDNLTEIELIAASGPLPLDRIGRPSLATLGRADLAQPGPINPVAVIERSGNSLAMDKPQAGETAALVQPPLTPPLTPPPGPPESAAPPASATQPLPPPVQREPASPVEPTLVVTRCTVKVQRATAL
ncbi:OmpA family protein [Azospirillum thiophilum]|nr:OmpA family protein [Azospirillum thiophilum]